MALEDLRARLDQMLADLARVTGSREATAGLYEAMVETRAAIAGVRDAIVATERELTVERTRLVDAERRGTLAEGIGDAETADLARIWSDKHRERVALLERKRAVQGEELAYAERQLEELTEAWRQAKLGVPPGAPQPELGVPDPELDRLDRQRARQAREAMVQEQLAALKKKLGREG
jgi:hypothetical protein